MKAPPSPCTVEPIAWSVTVSGLITRPQSLTMTKSITSTLPSSGSTVT